MSETNQKITGVVITLNESSNIKECLESLKNVCDELIVVDSNSKDNTVEIAESMGAKVYKQSYLGDGPQKNFGLQYASNKWILSLDADERLTEEMIKDIKSLDLDNTTNDAYAFRRRNLIGSRWLKRCGWYPDYCTRLYNKDLTRFKDVKQHSYVDAKNVQKLKSDILHYSFKNIGELFAKPGRPFTSRGAKILYKQGKKVNAFTPVTHSVNAFIRKYFIQGGILAGIDGLTVSLSAAIYAYIKYARLLEFYRDKKVLDDTDFNDVW